MPRHLTAALSLIMFSALITSSWRPAAARQGEMQGTINYDQTIKIEIELSPQMAHLADQIPDSRTMKRALHFTETESVMRDSPEQKAAEDERRREIQTQRGNARIIFRGARSGGPEEILYTSLETEETVQSRNFMGRTFLISGQREGIRWRLTNEQSEYEGYLTMKAVATVDSSNVEAWFTPQIPLPIGPDEYGGLPGAILVLTIDGGKQTWKATAIDLEATPEIMQPEDGREVTQEEFDEIVEEKRKEMQAQMGDRRGRGMIEMRINN